MNDMPYCVLYLRSLEIISLNTATKRSVIHFVEYWIEEVGLKPVYRVPTFALPSAFLDVYFESLKQK